MALGHLIYHTKLFTFLTVLKLAFITILYYISCDRPEVNVHACPQVSVVNALNLMCTDVLKLMFIIVLKLAYMADLKSTFMDVFKLK